MEDQTGKQELALYKDIGEAKAAMAQAKGFIDEMMRSHGLGGSVVLFALSKDNEMAFSGNQIKPPALKHKSEIANVLSQMVRDLLGVPKLADEHAKRHSLFKRIFNGKKNSQGS